jgi:hypothetical protein
MGEDVNVGGDVCMHFDGAVILKGGDVRDEAIWEAGDAVVKDGRSVDISDEGV